MFTFKVQAFDLHEDKCWTIALQVSSSSRGRRGIRDFHYIRCVDGCQSLSLETVAAELKLAEPTPTFLPVHNTTLALCAPGMGWMPSCMAEWGGDYTAAVLHAGRDSCPNPPCWSQRGLLFPQMLDPHTLLPKHTHLHSVRVWFRV